MRDRLDLQNMVFIVIVLFHTVICLVSLHYEFSPVIFPIGEAVLWDTASEANIWTWANVTTLTAAALASWGWSYASWKSRKPHGVGWFFVGGLLLSLSFDDLVGVHERLHAVGMSMGGGQGPLHFSWVVPGALIALLYLASLVFHAVRIAPLPRAYLIGGVCTFFLGAIGFEMISGAELSANGRTDAYVALYHVEEMLEAIGATLMLCSPLAALPSEARKLRRAPASA